MKGKLVLLAVMAALVGVTLTAGAMPLTFGGATGYGIVPSANVIPSSTATVQYSYIDEDDGISLLNVGAGWEGFEVTYSKWMDAFDDEDFFSAKYQLDLAKYDPEFDLPIKLAVGVGDIFDNSGFSASWYAVGTYTYELGAPIIGDVIPTLEFSLGTGNEMYDDVFYGIKADLGDFAGWFESIDVGEGSGENWGLEYNPSALPGLTVGFSDTWDGDIYTAAYNLAF